MEFYAKPKRLSLTPISVSIPNGMEFYLSKLQRAPDFGGFQFPTDRLPAQFILIKYFRFTSPNLLHQRGIYPAG